MCLNTFTLNQAILNLLGTFDPSNFKLTLLMGNDANDDNLFEAMASYFYEIWISNFLKL